MASYAWNREINPSFINDILDYRLIIQQYSEQTVYTDNSDFRYFLKFMKCYKKLKDIRKFNTIKDLSDISIEFIEDIELDNIIQYTRFLQEQGNSEKTIANKIISVKVLYKYLHTKLHLLKENKFYDLEIPKWDDKTYVYMPLNECEQLIDTIVKYKLEMWERDYCMIMWFLNTGMRLSELANAKISKLDLINRKIKIIGKGNIEREIPLNDACINSYNFYIKFRKGNNANIQNRDYIFLSKKFNRMGKRTIQEMIKKYLELAGLDTEKYSIHKLRHTSATLLMKSGVNLMEIKELLGHKNLSTTQKYLHVDNETLEKCVQKNPLANKKIS